MAIMYIDGADGFARTFLRGCLLLVALGVLYTLAQGVRVRYLFWRLKTNGVPIMPHSLLFGHFPVLAKLTAGLPKDIHINYISQLVYENWQTYFPDRKTCPAFAYIDLWPLAPPMIHIIDPEVGWQIIGDPTVRRSDNTMLFLGPLTENLDMASMEGAEWKMWRSRFNPAFSPKNVLSLVPGMIDDVEIFAGLVRKHAGAVDGEWGGVFTLEDLTTNLTIDIIARAALGIELREQTEGPSKLKSSLLAQMKLMRVKVNIFENVWSYNPVRQWKLARNRRHLKEELYGPVVACLNRDGGGGGGSRTLVDQAMQPLKELADEGKTPPPDARFITTVISQMKIFMFAGHDTTATSICWILHNVAKNPEVARKMRAEHDEVLGRDLSGARARLVEAPHLLNSLVYTSAVVKETLRLYPVVGSLREGSSRYSIVDRETGVVCPTEDFAMWDGPKAVSREDKLWPRANEFIPERWLTTDPTDPLYPPKNAWRPFGNGPRVCIGMELANTEMKLACVFLVREFDIDCAWDEWDALRNFTGPKETMEGHRCYQMGPGTPHVKDGMPIHVRRRREATS